MRTLLVKFKFLFLYASVMASRSASFCAAASLVTLVVFDWELDRCVSIACVLRVPRRGTVPLWRNGGEVWTAGKVCGFVFFSRTLNSCRMFKKVVYPRESTKKGSWFQALSCYPVNSEPYCYATLRNPRPFFAEAICCTFARVVGKTMAAPATVTVSEWLLCNAMRELIIKKSYSSGTRRLCWSLQRVKFIQVHWWSSLTTCRRVRSHLGCILHSGTRSAHAYTGTSVEATSCLQLFSKLYTHNFD